MISDKVLVFIVEDDEMFSTMLDYILSKESTHQFIRFNSGEECITNLYMHPDIILLDYGLPGIDGLETITKIKNHDHEISVIVLTANKNLSIAKKLLDAGADDYILKEENDIVNLIVETMNSLLNTKTLIQKQKRERDKKYAKTILAVIITILIVVLIALK